MTEPDPRTAATRVAVECLTLWLEPGVEARHNAASHISDLMHDEGGLGSNQVVTGLLNLSMFLALELAKERGAEDLLEGAREYLRGLSPRLPE